MAAGTRATSGAHRWALGIEYDGRAFHGWQRQTHAASVQSALEQALSAVADEAVMVEAAGRTDARVHATSQVVSFSTAAERPERAWILGTNSHLPAGVAVVWARAVPHEFHARFSALSRRYLYVYSQAPVSSALGDGQWWWRPGLDASAMHGAAQALLGEQDFSAVRAAGCQSASPFRCVHRVSVARHGQLLVLDIEANAFLLHMVRNIASMLAQVGEGRQAVSWPASLLRSKDRRLLGPTAPPQALYLAQVRYPPELELPGLRPPPVLAVLGAAAVESDAGRLG